MNWKKILMYVVKFVELIIAGGAGGAIGGNL